MAEDYKINIDINNNGIDDAEENFLSLGKAIDKAKQDLDAMRKANVQGTKEFKEAKAELDKMESAFKDLNKELKGVDASFEEVYGEVKPLTTALGEAEDRLYQLALAGDTTSKEYQQLLEKVTRYRKVQIETDQVVDASAVRLSEKLGGALQGVASGYAIAQGGMAIFGVESENLERQLLKVNAAMALSQGIAGLNEARKSFASLGRDAVAAIGGMNKALKLSLMGAFIATIIAAAVYWKDLKEAIFGAKEMQDEYNKIAENTKSKLTEVYTQVAKMETTFALAKKGVIKKEDALKAYNKTLGKSFGTATDLNEAEELFIKKTPAFIEAAVMRAEAEELIKMAAEKRLEASQAVSNFESDKGFWATLKDGATDYYHAITSGSSQVDANLKRSFEEMGFTQRQEADKYMKHASDLITAANKLQQDSDITADFSWLWGGDKDADKTTPVIKFEDITKRLFELQNEFAQKSLKQRIKEINFNAGIERAAILENEAITGKDKKILLVALKKNTEQEIAKETENERRRSFDFENQTMIRRVAMQKQTRDQEITLLQLKHKKEKDLNQRALDDGLITLMEFSRRGVQEGDKYRQDLRDINQKYDQIEYDKQDQQYKLLQEARETEEQRQITALVESYEAKFALAEGNAELEKALQERLNKDLAELNKKHREEEKKEDDKVLEQKRANMMYQLDIAYRGLGAINDLVQALADDNEKSQRKAFVVNKAIGIAQAVISTAQGVTKALAETTDFTPVQGLRFANAAIVAATGAAQIAVIAKQQFNPSGGGGGGGDFDIPSGGSASGGGSPSFNVVGNAGLSQLAALQMQPTQAYVVSGDITTAQSLDRNKIENATL
tara:strand:+ start:22894 stop:25431 length:2538 start_codon:yes stop_codon:yes gene_type:complete